MLYSSIWRPLNGPVVDWPLGVMDYNSLNLANAHPTDLWRKDYELRGQTMSFSHAKEQNWWYLREHQSDEVTVIKIWDNSRESTAKCTSSSLVPVSMSSC